MPFILMIMDNINLPKYHVHYVVTLKPISCIIDVTIFLPTHVNYHITPIDD